MLCRYQHHKATPTRELLPRIPLHRLLELTIERMQPLQLQQSLNTDRQLRLCERHYQMEFYRCDQGEYMTMISVLTVCCLSKCCL